MTTLAIVLRAQGAHRLVFYLAYPGIYWMQSFLQRFLVWLPFGIGTNAIAETFTFILANTASYAILIFLLLRIFIPDRSQNLPSLSNQK